MTNSDDFFPTENVLILIPVGYRIPGYLIHFFQHLVNILLPVPSRTVLLFSAPLFLFLPEV